MRRLALLASLAVAFASTAGAQAIRGVVVDSASRQPVPGVVVSLLDSTSRVIGRIITNQRGQFNVPSAAAVSLLRTQRIGFRLRVVPVRVAESGFTDIQIAVAALPTLLEPVKVLTDPGCPVRRDAPATFALLEQARAGLLATIVARESNPALMRILTFDRVMGGNSERILSQKVRIDSGVSAQSFGASRQPSQFVAIGFARFSGNEQEYFAPDADVLLSDEFSSGYCFRIVGSPRGRSGQIGLGFDPMNARRDRVQISGALWIDTVSRVLKDVEFRYLNLGREPESIRPGGRLSFAETRPDIVVIDRWTLRMPRARADSSYPINNNLNLRVRVWHEAVETGAELAYASWPDSTEWRGHLGTLRARVQVGGKPAPAGMPFRLIDTDYRALTDSLGMLGIGELLPGPYVLSAYSPELDEVGVDFPASLRFTAARDSVISTTIEAPTLEAFAFKACVTDKYAKADAPRHHLIIGQVVNADGKPVAGAAIKAKRLLASEYFIGSPTAIRTGTDGRFEICIPERLKDQDVTIVVSTPLGERLLNVSPREMVVTRRIVVE